MTLTIRGKVFEINFVSNYVHEKYAELIGLAGTIVDRVKVEEIEGVAKVDKKKAIELIKEIEASRKDIAKKIIMLRREMVREVVEGNDIYYDVDWWQKKTDPDDINNFLLSCLQKDIGKARTEKKK